MGFGKVFDNLTFKRMDALREKIQSLVDYVLNLYLFIFFSMHNKLKLNLNTLILYRPWCKKTQGHLAYTKNGTYNFQIQLQK